MAGGFKDANLDPKGFAQYTSLSAMKKLSDAPASGVVRPTGATRALISAETKDVRWRDDGTSPTASVGMVIPAGTTFLYTGDLAAFRMIETAASAVVGISYYS